MPQQKNVRIMLVGNKGTKGNYKANIVDQNQYLPKTTKNKFYSQGGNQEFAGGFLNALSTPQNKQTSFRHDGPVTMHNQSQGGVSSIRQSAQVERAHQNPGFISVQHNATSKSASVNQKTSGPYI